MKSKKRNKSTLALSREPNVEIIDSINDEIIDDTALIDCINELNGLRDSEASFATRKQPRTERDVLDNINQISAEMRWFSQWLTVKSNSAA